MSWMDSWSRPGKYQTTPVPFYLLPNGEATPYCHSCGRVMSPRRTAQATRGDADGATRVRYCSSSCRSRRPGKLDREIERVFVGFLNGEGKPSHDPFPSKGSDQSRKGDRSKKIKGDARILVSCDEVEGFFFPDGEGATAGSQAGLGGAQAHDEAIVDYHREGSQHLSVEFTHRPLATLADSVAVEKESAGRVQGSGKKMKETDEMLERRKQGQRRARQREMVRCAARRGVVFGFVVDEAGNERAKCETVMKGKVVEPSFAKGNWSIRWRE